MEKFIEYINGLQNKSLDIMESRGAEIIQATQRNALKAELTKEFYKALKRVYPYTFISDKGVLLEIANDSVADKITNDLGSGAITVKIDFVIPSLTANAELEEKFYLENEVAKAREKAEKEKSKASKIARDKLAREAAAKAKADKASKIKAENNKAKEGEGEKVGE